MAVSDAQPRIFSAWLLWAGAATPFVFAGTLVVCGTLFGDYSHLSRQVSDLGALGTPTQHLFSAGLLVCSILSVLFVYGLYSACRALQVSVLPVIAILSFSVSIAGAAIFPLPLRMHLISGMPSILLPLSPLLALMLWRRSRPLSSISGMASVSFAVMCLGYLAFFPSILAPYPGLKQRFFHAGWSIWFLVLAYRFSNLHSADRLAPRLD